MPLGDDWTLQENGNIEALPFAGYQIARMPPIGLLRLEYFATVESLDARQVSAVQVHMNAPQARELAMALLKMADSLEPPERSGMQ